MKIARLMIMLVLCFFPMTALGHETEEQAQEREEQAEDPEDPEAPKRGLASRAIGLGGGLVLWPNRQVLESPAIVLEMRKYYLMFSTVGVVWASNLVFHDFRTMQAVYGWYFDGTSDEVRNKVMFLWPGLVLAPLFGANYTTGVGLAVFTSPSVPAVHFDLGPQMTLFLWPSNRDFIADFGFGAFAGMGLDFSRHLGLSVRAAWAPTVLHGLFGEGGGSVVTVSAALNVLTW